MALNPSTMRVTVQYHVVFDYAFSTVTSNHSKVLDNCSNLVSTSMEGVDLGDDMNRKFVDPPPLGY